MLPQVGLEPLGGGNQKLITLNQAVMLLGRSKGCDLIIDRPSVSKVHAVFVNDGLCVRLRDLLSVGGTRVRGRAVHEAMLGPDDQIRFGAFAFRFVGPKPPAVEPESNFWVLLTDIHSGRRWRFSRRVVLIGSQEGCDVLIQRSDVVGLHAILVRVSDHLIILRKLCHNGPLARNGQPTNLSKVENCDLINVGPVTLSVTLSSGQLIEAMPLRDAGRGGDELLEWSNAGMGDSMWTLIQDVPNEGEETSFELPTLSDSEHLELQGTELSDDRRQQE